MVVLMWRDMAQQLQERAVRNGRALMLGLLLVGSLSQAPVYASAGAPSSPTAPYLLAAAKQQGQSACPVNRGFPMAGSTQLSHFTDFADVGNYAAYRCAIDWYLQSGVENGGKTWTEFAPDEPLQRWEVAHALYRFFIIMNESSQPSEDVVPSMEAFPRYLPAVVQLRGAGVFGELPDNLFHPQQAVTVEELLTWVYRAANSTDAAVSDGAKVTPGSQADLQSFSDSSEVGDALLPAVAGMVRSGHYRPLGANLAPKAVVTRLQLVNLLYSFSAYRTPKVINADAEQRLKARLMVDGKSHQQTGLSLAVAEDNFSALYARNGARVVLNKADIRSSSPYVAPYELAYRWGLNGAVVANGAGTSITLKHGSVTSESGGAYALYPVGSGVINVKDSILTRDDYTMMVTVNGQINLDRVTIRGKGRTFSSDHFGGTVTYRHVDSVKQSGMGGGGFMLDEHTSGLFYDSSLVGDAYICQCTGLARVVMHNTQVKTATGFHFQNNTSMPSDIGSVTLDGGSIDLDNSCTSERDCMGKNYLFDVRDSQRLVVKANGTRFALRNGIQVANARKNAHIRLYLTDTALKGDVLADDSSSVEIYLHNATFSGKTSGRVTVTYF